MLYNSQNITQATGTPKKAICLGMGRYAFNTDNKVVILTDNALATAGFQKNNIAVSPNPATDFIAVSGLEDQSMAWVTVFDMMGKNVLSTSMTDARINVSGLEAGFYILKIKGGNGGEYINKFIKK